MIVLRPADANEVREAYKVILEQTEEPACLVLSRQKLPVFDRERYAPASGLARGAYVHGRCRKLASRRSSSSPAAAKCSCA